MFSDAGNLYVSDVERSSIYRFLLLWSGRKNSPGPALIHRIYAGLLGDTIVAFSPVRRAFDLLSNGIVEATIPAQHGTTRDASSIRQPRARHFLLR